MRKILFVVLILFSSALYAQKVETLGSGINSEYNELHPIISMDGKTMYFVRAGHPMNNKADEYSNDIWFSQKSTDGRWSIAKKMPRQLNRDRYNDLFDISADGSTALIRNSYQKGIINQDRMGISIIKKKGTIWQSPEMVDIPNLGKMIRGKYLSACMSNNGRVIILAFSEKKNGSDDNLYITTMDRQGKWSAPKQLNINSKSSDRTPHLSADNTTLYFSSNRKGGYGGYDIWMSKRLGSGWNAWSTPVNMGPEINTDKDEMYYTTEASGEYAYFTSQSNSLGYHDIFRIKTSDIQPEDISSDAALQTTVVARNEDDLEEEENVPTNVVVVSGKVTDITTGKGVEAKIIYEDLDKGEELGIATSNPQTGDYKIVLPYGKRYGIRPELDGSLGVSTNIDLTTPGDYKEITGQNLDTAPLEKGTVVTLYNIFFEFAKATLEKESFLELDRMIGVMNKNPNMAIEIQGHTDNVGSDEVNDRLSLERADAVKSYFLSNGVSADRVKSVGFGSKKPKVSNETTEGQAQNRRVEFVVLRK